MFLTKGKKQKLVVQVLKNVGAMIDRGVPLPDALEHVARSTSAVLSHRRLYAIEKILPSPAAFLEKVFMSLRQHTSSGSMLSEAAALHPLVVTGDMVNAIAQGEANGTLPKALIELDGIEMGDWCCETESPIVKLVNGILIRAVKLSAEAIAFPSLPEGQVLTPIESSVKCDASSSTANIDSDFSLQDDLDACIAAAVEPVIFYDGVEPPNWRIYYRLREKWVFVIGLPGRILGPITRRLLVMANIPYWSKEPQKSIFRLRTEKGLREFSLEYNPAAKHVYIELLPAQLATLADVKAAKADSGIALVEMSAYGQIETVKELLSAGADVNARNKEGHTALILASWNGNIEAVKELLAAGADVNAMDKKGYTALRLAATQGHIEVLKALLSARVDVNVRNENGATLLMEAAGKGQIEAVKELLAAGADVNAADELCSFTALMIASSDGNIEVVKALLAAGADVNAKAKKDDGMTALMYALWNGNVEVVKALLSAKADVNAKSRKGGTALKIAMKMSNAEVVELLKNAGAKK